jgi:FkbM family methyltransferase
LAPNIVYIYERVMLSSMPILTRVLHLIPGALLERVYYSKLRYIFLPLYDYLNKNEHMKIYKIIEDILMEVDISKPAERAIPFGAYEPKITKKFLESIKEGDVVCDVGAWIGYYSILAAKRADRVISIEPDETNYQRMKRNIDLNNLSNVTTLNLAVGDRISRGVLEEGPQSVLHKVVLEAKGKAIDIEPLDHIIKNRLKINRVDMLIMDIEGSEYLALKGMQHLLSTGSISKIICEVHPDMIMQNSGGSEVDVVKLLSESGYEFSMLDKTETSRPYHIYAKFEVK